MLSALNALTEAVLERAVTFTFFDMLRDSHTYYLGNWLTVDGCDRVKLLRLLGRKANRHGFDRFHGLILRLELMVVKCQTVVVY